MHFEMSQRRGFKIQIDDWNCTVSVTMSNHWIHRIKILVWQNKEIRTKTNHALVTILSISTVLIHLIRIRSNAKKIDYKIWNIRLDEFHSYRNAMGWNSGIGNE